MKIRCGSHQQNRSIVRPGLSLMATKVALTAEEFRENSQRSIALFNTEKLSTDSTHVLKSAYCNSVHFCRCNLHGACGGKAVSTRRIPQLGCCCNLHGACGGKVVQRHMIAWRWMLQSARSVWRQRLAMLTPLLMQIVAICTERVEAKGAVLHPRHGQRFVAICTERVEAKLPPLVEILNRTSVAICTERVEAKDEPIPPLRAGFVAICTERVEAKVFLGLSIALIALQSARSVWRQSFILLQRSSSA